MLSLFFLELSHMTRAVPQIAGHALLLSFMRTHVGKEFEVANNVSHRFHTAKPMYYTCYGRYDLLELATIHTHEERYDIPVQEFITEVNSALFYAWEGTTRPLNEWLDNSPVLLLVFLTFEPWLIERTSFQGELGVIRLLQAHFGTAANCYIGMGQSECLLLLKGRDCSSLLDEVTTYIRQLRVADLGRDCSVAAERDDANRPLFIATTSYLTIAHPGLGDGASYGVFSGTVSPTVAIDCAPGLEECVCSLAPAGSTIRNLYGAYDIAIAWPKPISIEHFAKTLTDFRSQLSQLSGINGTCTTFSTVREATHLDATARATKNAPNPLAPTKDLALQTPALDRLRRGQLLDFLGRLDSYYSNPMFHSFFKDMAGLRKHIACVLRSISDAPPSDRQNLQMYLSMVIDLANHAIYQRHSGVEAHFDFRQHVPFPSLCDINGYIAASSALPLFLYSAFADTSTVDEVWPGFVLFGQSYSYQLLRGHVLSYHADALLKPVEDWWGITHEIAHSLYLMTDFWNSAMPEELREELTNAINETQIEELRFDIDEIYAHWFDYRYVFAGNKDVYFPMIWNSWLRWERTRTYPRQYLLRSLAVYLSDCLDEWYTKGWDDMMTYLNDKLDEMNSLICRSVPNYGDFVASVKGINALLKVLPVISSFIGFLEKKYFDAAVFARINPFYAALGEHVAQIRRGEVVREGIVNPLALCHGLYEACEVPRREVPLQVNAATALSLWNYYSTGWPCCLGE